MLQMNYYEMLGLPCDGKDANDVKLIERTLKQWEAFKMDARNNESKEAKRKQLQTELDELPNMRRLITDAALRKTHADDLKNKRLAQVDAIIGIMSAGGSGEKSIARARIQKIAVQVGLEAATVTKSFQGSGYTVVPSKPVNVNDFVLEPRIITAIDNEFRMIRDHMQANPNEVLQEIREAGTLYEYLAIMEGQSKGHAAEYERKTAQELSAKFEDLSHKHVSNAAPIRFYQSINLSAKTDVMRDAQQKRKYDNAMKLKQIGLLKLLPSVPVTVKLEHAFAEGCIREIMAHSFDEDQAIAVYNRYGEMPLDSLYEKESTRIATMCTCRMLNYHDTIEQAQRAKCSSCGNPLYVKCRKCGKPVPAVADFCACGFFMKGVQMFGLHRRSFDDAVKAMDLSTAKREFNLAQESDPSNESIAGMKAQLKRLEDELGKPIQEIESLIGGGMINAARQAVNRLLAARPGVDLKKFQTRINGELAWADGEFDRCRRSAGEGAGVEICSGIVNRVKDHQQALEWLRQHPPKPVMEVSVTEDARALSCVVQWKDDPENRYVKYSVVRKEGSAPVSVMDGTLVASGLTVREHQDRGLAPGRVYVYGVFAVRGDAVSKSAGSRRMCLFKSIDDVQISIGSKACTLSWTDVPGSRGVQVRRSEDGGRTYATLSPVSRGVFTDSAIGNGKQYRYSLTTIWEVDGKHYGSRELTRDVRIEQKPPRVDLSLVSSGSDGSCEVAWTARGEGVIRIIALKPGVSIVPDREYTQDMIAAMGSVIKDVPVQNGRFSWFAQPGKRFRVAALRLYGSSAVGGAAVEVTTVAPLQVDENKTIITDNTLRLVLAQVPENVTRIYYRVASGSSVADENAAARNELSSVDAQSCIRSQNTITVENLPETRLTVTLIAMYGAGANAFFSPVTAFEISNLPRQRIDYRLEWKTRGMIPFRHKVRDGAKLIVRPEGDRIPGMTLCARQNGKMLFNYVPGMPGVAEIIRISPCAAEPGKEYSYALDEANMRGIPAGTVLQLFLDPKEAGRYSAPLVTDVDCRMIPAE